MNPEYTTPAKTRYDTDEQRSAPATRLTDEKISDDTGLEAKLDKAHAPAGLKNPFWK